MPQIIIHTSLEPDQKMLEEIRETLPSILNIKPEVGQVILYTSNQRLTHPNRNQDFIVVEITLKKGRTHNIKKVLAEKVISIITCYTDIPTKDINLVYYEIDQENFFGGL